MHKSAAIKKLIMILALAPLALIYNNCMPFRFQGFSVAQMDLESTELSSLQGKTLYTQHCSSCHGGFEQSTIRGKSLNQIQWALNNVSAMGNVRFAISDSDSEAIALALNDNGAPPGSRYQYACVNDSFGKTEMQRLSGREYKNTLRDLLARIDGGIISDSTIQSLLTSLPMDVQNGKEMTLLIQRPHVESYFRIAYRAATVIASNSNYLQQMPGTNGCLNAANITSSCVNQFVRDFGLLAFRRPLSSSEMTRYQGHFNDSTLSSNRDKIVQTLASLMMAPDFNYRIPDQGTSAGSNLLRMTDYELASKMSYLLTGTMPDAALFARAADGTLGTNAVLDSEIQRLLGTTGARDMVLRFFREWMHYDRFDSFGYTAEFLNGISTTNLAANMTREVDEMLNHLILNQDASFQDLMTTRQSFVYAGNLSQIYGIANPNGGVTLPADRQGLFSRAAFLTKRSGNLTSPIKRGLFILEDVLCQGVGAPPPDAPGNLTPLPPGQYLTTRARVEHMTQTPGTSCLACHGRMNPLGFPFEGFDSLGRVRALEPIFNQNGTYSGTSLPVTTATETNELLANPVQIEDAIGLQEHLGNNDRALACMTKKWFEYTQRRLAANDDNCQMNDILSTVYGTPDQQGSLKDMIKQTILAPKFRLWRF